MTVKPMDSYDANFLPSSFSISSNLCRWGVSTLRVFLLTQRPVRHLLLLEATRRRLVVAQHSVAVGKVLTVPAHLYCQVKL